MKAVSCTSPTAAALAVGSPTLIMLEPKKWQVIGGRYRLEQEIARGGMGSVWAGQDTKLRRRVAVKLVAPDWAAAGDTPARFEREAMAVAQLQSPHVVQIFDYGVDKLCPFIVMELLEGEDLRNRLHRQQRLTLESAALVLVQTAKALSVAHAAGIIHRDLKPGNIFLVRQGEEEIVKVLDFGVAKQVRSATPSSNTDAPVLGTPQFMSPEQARGLPDVDHRTDLWALGVIIYRALTGRLPFHAPTPTEVIVKVCTEQPVAVSQLAPDLPRELDAFFARALARDRARRFESARQLATAFSRISPVAFTTLSMPDPGPAIEQAMGLTAVAAEGQDEGEPATVAVDGLASTPLWEDDADDERTSVAGGAAPAASEPPPSVLPPPRLPPRRGARPVTARSPGAAPPPLPRRSAAAAGAGPAQAGPPSSAAPVVASVPEPPVSNPVLLTRTRDHAPAPPAQRPSPVPASLRPSHPTLEGGVMEQPHSSAPAGGDRSTRPTLLLALAAVVVGVLIAVVGSAVIDRSAGNDATTVSGAELPAGGEASTTAPTAVAKAAPTEDHTPGTDATTSAEPTDDGAGDDEHSANKPGNGSGHRPTRAAADEATGAHKPAADAAATRRRKPAKHPPARPVATKTPPQKPAPTATPPPPPKPADGSDPFADRL